jgi:hypothetical protein
MEGFILYCNGIQLFFVRLSPEVIYLQLRTPQSEARGSVVVCYNSEGRGFDTR